MRPNVAGFTLLELIVVVALVGVLSAIGISDYQKYSARAKQAEAKIALSAMYASEMAFSAEQGSFTECLEQTGYVPAGQIRYYFTGFMAAATSTCGPDGASYCGNYAWNPDSVCDLSCPTFDTNGFNQGGWGPTAKVSASAVLINTCAIQSAVGVPNAWAVTQSDFIVGAAGNISTSGAYDMWQIDQTKTISNIQPGL